LVHFADFARLPQTARRLVCSHEACGWNPDADSFPSSPIGAPFLYLSAPTADIPVTRQDAAVASPLVFLRHPMSHLPGTLPRLPRLGPALPEPLVPADL